MAAINEITGDAIQTRKSSEAYRNNYDLIFGKKKSTKGQDSDSKKSTSCDAIVSDSCDVNGEGKKP